ncbi:UPF0175 family protein [Spirulina sp. 06S082]|uniref:UPF0175 family protein n=1 Tax=Spirulina sp. 06S082 TaxID=3110248 RepID=UPI002B2173C1|nr:UPF0175 family protein [Spirulina sp. 06S082]
MSILIPDEVLKASGMSENELMLELIILLFQQKKISIGKAANLVKMNLLQFQHELAIRKISIHYEITDLETDMKNLKKLGRL